MKLNKFRPRIARLLVAILGAGFIQVSVSAPAAQASTPNKPTISSITSGATSLTVNMVTTGITATQWRWSITRRVTSGCANTLGDGVVQSTGSLSATIAITGLTANCVYSVRVAGFNNNLTGEFAESSRLVGGFTNGLLAYHRNEAGFSSAMTRVPFTDSTCGTGTVAILDIQYGATGPSGCNTDGFTSYYLGFIRAPITGTVTFKARSDDGFILNIQGNNVISVLTEQAPAAAGSFNGQGTVNMVAGEIYRLEAWHHEYQSGAAVSLDWQYSGQAQTVVPTGSLATDPSVFAGTCPMGLVERCPAGSAYEIKLATNTNMDGMYWIMVNGTPTLTYSIMNSAFSGGGWMLAMKGKKSASDLDYGDGLWTNTTTLNAGYPERWRANDTVRDVDAKYGVYGFNRANQIMAIFPEQTTFAGGAVAAATTSPINSSAYGFNWIETLTNMRPWAAYNANAANGNPAGWGGTSWNVAFTGGPTATPTCVNSATTLTNLFSTASRCAFRQVSSSYSASESPYSAIGEGLFYSQTQIRFFGINYGSANTGNRDRARFGFGWNENDAGNEVSNDGTAGIGIDRQGYSSTTTGSINNCCATQNGLSGGNGTSTNIPFEMYMRNTTTATITGSNLRITFQRQSSLTAGNGFTVSGTNGDNTFRMSQLREGIAINPSNGVLTVSEALPIGTYQETVTVTDTNGVVGFRAVSIQVLADSSDTDTALAFTGAASLSTSGTFALTGNQTWEAWVRPTSACDNNIQKTVFGSDNFVLLCVSGYWNASFRNSAGAWSAMQGSQRINYDSWTHLAVVRSGTTASLFINNAQVRVWGGSSWDLTWQVPSMWATPGPVYLGGHSGSQFFSGEVDELTIWSEARTLNQIIDSMYAAPALGSANLFGYWDFNEGSGISAVSRSQISDTRYNFTPLNSQWVTVASTTTSGPYTVVRIPRTLITKAGGWRVPNSITAVSVLLVGGGGGGSGAFTSDLTAGAGAGGGGGVYFAGSVPVTPNNFISLRVGAGGAGGTPTNDRGSVYGFSGGTTTFSALSAGGGGAGGYLNSTNQDGLPGTAGGAGGGASNFWQAFDSGSPGLSSSATISGQTFPASATSGSGAIWNGSAGHAGGGAGGDGSATARGVGIASTITGENISYGVGGGSIGVTSWNFSQLTSFGNGGDAPYNWNIGGAQGGSGLVVVRYITALKPAFTQPTNTTLNVGMTETFTVNVALDSATAGLTRTFRWESSTTGSAGTFSTIKQGTGATNAFFAWVPPDTATSGSNFLFRVIITDSDTAGLFIQETSSAVFATINRALLFTGKNSISKTVGLSKSETFTVLHGTPSYRYTLVPDSAFFWLDTVTATTPRLRIADTATVGTYFETITVIDSVSAAVSIPLTIKVSPPPSFSANAEQVDSGTVLFLDAGNSASFPRSGTSWNDQSGRNLSTSIQPTGMPATANSGPTSCALVEYSNETLGSMKFSSIRQTCAYVTGLGLLPNYTLQVWVKRDGTQTDYTGVIGTPWAGVGNQINMSLHWINVGGELALEGGIWNGSTWVVARSAAIPNLTWVLATLTFNSLTLTPSLTINNAKITGSNSNTALTANLNSPNLLIGKRFDTNNFYFNGSVGSVRVYNRVLTDSEILQNYNATLGRFTGTQNKQSNVGKYGTTVNETITVTAGSETLTASFTSAAIAGLRWDTSTVRSLQVQLQESLTAGTYSDTVTVTDIYGSSSNFPLTFTVGKADTITVIIDTPTALSYTGSTANFTPTVRVTGLVASDTGTAVSTINYKPGGLTCATGGSCVIGDIGPGGGIVFITPATVGGNGRFFEAAPANWAGTDDMSTAAKFCTASTTQDNTSRSATQFGIGWGETNTALFEPHCTGGAVKLVSDYAGGGFTNWFIPNSNELVELAKVREGAGLLQLGSGWTTGRFGYWGSTEESAGVMRTLVTVNGAWNIGSTSKSDATNNMVRPVRMFMPCWGVDTCTSLSTTTRPTDAGTYSILPAGLSLTQGNLANYQAIRYQSSTVTINRVAQRAIELPFYSPTYPETLTIFFGGGSGTGAVRFIVTNGGSATGCAADYRKIATTSVGTCQVQVVKAGDRNHFAETTTAAINFIQFIFTQLAPTVGSGPTIALNGINIVTIDADTAPIISSLSASSGAVGSTLTINGAGFFFANPSLVEIRFSRSVLATTYTLVSDSVITVTVPAGATTAPILVVTPHGAARSATFTVLP